MVNNWTKIVGNHSVKFGVDLRYARNLRVPSDSDRTGVNNFGNGPSSNGVHRRPWFRNLHHGRRHVVQPVYQR